MSNPFDGAEVISAYSRAQAIEDGVVVDVSETAREAGIKYPVALTRAVWESCVSVPKAARCQDEAGRLWDVVWMLAVALRAGKTREGYGVETVGGMMQLRREPARDRILYHLLVVQDSKRCNARTGKPCPPLRRTVTLKAVCGPGDDGEPTITVMEPDED